MHPRKVEGLQSVSKQLGVDGKPITEMQDKGSIIVFEYTGNTK